MATKSDNSTNIEVRVNSEIEAAEARAQDLKANLSLLLILPIGLLAYLAFSASSHTTGPEELIPTLTATEVGHWISVNEEVFADRDTDARTRAAHTLELEALRDRLIEIRRQDASTEISDGLAAIERLIGTPEAAVSRQVDALTASNEEVREITLAERVEGLEHRTANLEWILDHPGTSFQEKAGARAPIRELLHEVKVSTAEARSEGDTASKETLGNLRYRLSSLLTRSTAIAAVH